MTRRDVGYYVLAALLFAASIPLYRVILAHAGDGDQPAQSPQPVAVARTRSVVAAPARARSLPVDEPPVAGREGQLQCWHGLLYTYSLGQWAVRVSPNGQLPQCEIQVESVRPENSQASDDSQGRSTP